MYCNCLHMQARIFRVPCVPWHLLMFQMPVSQAAYGVLALKTQGRTRFGEMGKAIVAAHPDCSYPALCNMIWDVTSETEMHMFPERGASSASMNQKKAGLLSHEGKRGDHLIFLCAAIILACRDYWDKEPKVRDPQPLCLRPQLLHLH